MLAPMLVGLTLLIAVPAMLTLPVAFTNFNAISAPEWRGLGNFSEMLHDERFWGGLKASLLFVVLSVPLRLLGALLLGLLLYRGGRGTPTFRSAVYLPTVVPDVAWALLWLYIFNPLFGPLNWALRAFGVFGSGDAQPAGWLLDPTSAQLAIVIMLFWTLGEGFVIMMAALQDIPRDLQEAASIDGAGIWQRFWTMTLPLIAPMMLLVAFRDTIHSFQANFVATTILTQGGPYYSTTYLPYWIYGNAIEFGRFGYAAAMTLVLFAITGAFIALQFLVIRRWRLAYFE